MVSQASDIIEGGTSPLQPAGVIGTTKPVYAYIDCTRAYAILLVITCHLTYEFSGLPYPVHRLTVLGWHGVQLFFLASAVTLLMSWHHEVNQFGVARIAPFFVRRFFRIAPAYYCAAALYYVLMPPAEGSNATQLLASLLFVNAWTPALMPTVEQMWSVVPGGWSIGVEFTFYMLFPIFAAMVISLPRAVVALAGCLVVGWLANRAMNAPLLLDYTAPEVNNFLYFWFPNQMAVFGAGGVVYFIMRHLAGSDFSRLRHIVAQHGTLLACIAVLGFLTAAYLPLAQWLGQSPRLFPAHLYVCIPLAGFMLVLSLAPGCLFVNRYAAAMGKVSFSAYLLHFAVLRFIVHGFPAVFHTHSGGYAALLAFAGA